MLHVLSFSMVASLCMVFIKKFVLIKILKKKIETILCEVFDKEDEIKKIKEHGFVTMRERKKLFLENAEGWP